MTTLFSVESEPEPKPEPRRWLPWFAGAVLLLLFWIGWNIQSAESRRQEAQREYARQAAAYLDCTAHAKYPDLCIAPAD